MLFQPFNPAELVVRLAAIVDSSEDAIVSTDENGIITTWNSAATRLFGYQPNEIIGKPVLLIVPPSLHEEQRGHMDRLRVGARVEHCDTVLLAKGGERVDVSLSISPIHNDDGRMIGMATVARDVRSRQRERAAQARLAAIVESSDDAIIAKDLNGIITDWNAAAERLFGYSAEEIIGRSMMTIIPPDLQHEEPVVLAKIRAGDRIEHYETQRLHKNGKRLDVSLTTSPIRNSHGVIIGASKIARDISERRTNESARLMLAAIVESSDDAIISKNLDGVITSWNASAQRLFGYTPDEIVGHSVLRLMPPELYHEEPVILGKLRRGERIEHFETRRVKKNGELFDISLTVSPIKDSTGRVIGASKIVRDISERKAAEALLIEKERLAAIGRMAATLAHEVNNPLESIMNLSFILSESPDLPESLKGFANLLVNEVLRAGDITRQVLSFHRESRVLGDVDVAATLDQVLSTKRRRLEAKSITVEKEFQARVVRGYSGELRQVFDNMIDNAIEASPVGGTIRLRTRASSASGIEKLVITICDNGPGIPPEILPKMFQPFFTTKSSAGSGLGLWVSLGIVQKHHGSIRVRSFSGKKSGSVFRITLAAKSSGEALDASRTAA